jgi:hypothetical protein
MFNNKECSEFRELMQARINTESKKGISQRIRLASDTKNSIKKTDTPQDILDKLEMVVGPVRLLIIAGESGEIISHHNIERSEAEHLQDGSHGICTIWAGVFDRQRSYQYLIDRGSREGTSQFTDAERTKIIEPIVQIYIERLERTYFSVHADHGAYIREHEEGIDANKKIRDYSAFIERVLSDELITGDTESGEYYAQAIDIARLVMSQHRKEV